MIHNVIHTQITNEKSPTKYDEKPYLFINAMNFFSNLFFLFAVDIEDKNFHAALNTFLCSEGAIL